MKMEPHSKHQEDDTHFGQLGSNMSVPDKARRIRTDHHPGDQVTHDGRETQAVGNRTKERAANASPMVMSKMSETSCTVSTPHFDLSLGLYF